MNNESDEFIPFYQHPVKPAEKPIQCEKETKPVGICDTIYFSIKFAFTILTGVIIPIVMIIIGFQVLNDRIYLGGKPPQPKTTTILSKSSSKFPNNFYFTKLLEITLSF